MENQRRVVCPENGRLAQYMTHKMQELADSPKGLSENTSAILNKAHLSVCNSKTPITSLKDFSQVKGVGKWIVRVMKGFFEENLQVSETEDASNKKAKGSRRYLPQKNSVAYALLITLYRGTSNGNEFMRKQDLIDVAEASGLSRAPIAPEKGKGKSSHFGSSPREWYSGWSCMKTLITKGLVVKSSCPAKYMLSQEGKEAACECIVRSGLLNSTNSLCEGSIDLDDENTLDPVFNSRNSSEELTIQQQLLKDHAKSNRRVRRLPVGDAIWIAHHKYLDNEYVLDFIVERKKVDDLRSSIRDNRYKDQKLKLLRCGLKRIIYVVEGDPNFSEASESIKTACFTTEILEGFDVHRTSCLGDTLKKYGFLTQAIAHYYTLEHPDEGLQRPGVCPQFDEFIRRCQDLEKMTVSDVFAIQLMQVPHVTEEVALAVLDIYPTLLSLVQAYALLVSHYLIVSCGVLFLIVKRVPKLQLIL
ncbi:hypothetical protein SAY86_027793 [Trapa natans]|uniref:Crossover junction endonuclease MUS81 n=1 Tax=Trapa natans TaxID=22666 RepID=A0AAN7KSD5_TRANT|nr:hypothetical protein SAY86_027793 [Trapa natans]